MLITPTSGGILGHKGRVEGGVRREEAAEGDTDTPLSLTPPTSDPHKSSKVDHHEDDPPMSDLSLQSCIDNYRHADLSGHGKS